MKHFRIAVNGTSYDVEVTELDGAVSAAAAPVSTPAAPAPVAGGQKVNAPMPGTILEVRVTEGAAVKKGDILLILEAMKMENEIMAPCDGTVKQIVAAKGASVNSGDPLIVIG